MRKIIKSNKKKETACLLDCFTLIFNFMNFNKKKNKKKEISKWKITNDVSRTIIIVTLLSLYIYIYIYRERERDTS